MNSLNDKRDQSIELLQYYYFLDSLVKTQIDNSFIQAFLEMTKTNYLSNKTTQIADYKTILSDYVFMCSGKFYLKTLQRFVSKEISGTKFVDIILPQFYKSLVETVSLQMDFERQPLLQLKPEIFQFSAIIGTDLFAMVKAFDEKEITETDLRQLIEDGILPKLEKYF